MSARWWRWALALTLATRLGAAQDAPPGPPGELARVEREAAWWRRKGEALRRAAAEARAGATRGGAASRVEQRELAAGRDLAADAAYAEAVRGYDRLLAAEGPNCARRAERAAALFGGRRYEEAGQAYAALRDLDACEARLPLYAAMAVRALEAQVIADARAGRMDACVAVRAGAEPGALVDHDGRAQLVADTVEMCQEPPIAAGVVEAPPLVDRLLAARVAYGTRARFYPASSALAESGAPIGADGRVVVPPSIAECALENALAVMRFGRLGDAEPLLRAILTQYCDEGGVKSRAAEALGQLLRSQRRDGEIEEVERMNLSRCSEPPLRVGNPPFRPPLDLFQRAERGEPADAADLYQRASQEFVLAVHQNQHHPQAALALRYGAVALERAGRPASAARLYLQAASIADHPHEGMTEPPDVRAQRLEELARARYGAAVALEGVCAYDEALTLARLALVDASAPEAQRADPLQRDVFQAILRLTLGRGRWDEAAAALAEVVAHARDASLREDAAFGRMHLPYLAGRWREATAALGAWLRAPEAPRDGSRRVQALWELAQAHRHLGARAAYLRAMREAARVFRERRLALDGPAAPLAAEAMSVDLDERVGALLRAPALPPRMLRAQLDAIDRDAWDVERLGGPHAVAASYRAAQAFEHAAQRLGDPSLRVRAIARYGAAVHAARTNHTPSLFADAALSRLQEVDTRAAIEAALQAQEAFVPAPRMLRHAPAGATLLEDTRVTTTELAR
jgi:tetratricopeptide (TPR) repeat protein